MKNSNINLDATINFSPLSTSNPTTDKQVSELINTPNCDGSITSESVPGGISLSQIEISNKAELTLKMPSGKNQALQFIYCREGEALIKLTNTDCRKNLGSFQTAIVSGDESSDVHLYIKPNQTCSLSVISVDKTIATKDEANFDLTDHLVKLITNGDNDAKVCHVGSRNLGIGMAVKELSELKGEGLARELILAGKVRVILGLEYQQYLNDKELENVKPSALTKSEMRRVSTLIEEIKANPGAEYTVTSLSRKACLSENKLQEGFKELFGRTVTDCIRNIRLEEAEELLKTTEMNVSEVVYTVGFVSRSYFSKIFKTKYNCSPSFYRTNLRHAQVA
ncbi:AraC family transcriptional regulator [Winogradskyella maritima]|uniref:Helix-turn-helix domain-containing protein n=1 Tax=Winogradskyella maritima TaxID=1517766 RepID=A0ABV8AIQ2_9FLAO|nr:AraC family transcriptional regulator [Winogradskyella maritima]